MNKIAMICPYCILPTFVNIEKGKEMPKEGDLIPCGNCPRSFKLVKQGLLLSTAKLEQETDDGAVPFDFDSFLEQALGGGRQKGVRINLSGAALFDKASGERIGTIVDRTAEVLGVTPGCNCPFCEEVRAAVEKLPKAGDAAARDPGERFRQEYGGEAPATEAATAADRTVPGILREAAATYEQRNPAYGNTYKNIGPILAAMFPGGLTLETPEEWARFGVFFQAVGKLARYAPNLKAGGHFDSALDGSVYCSMLAELTQEKK